jgi:HicB family
MKRIIDGKTYNTDTATSVARYEYENDSGHEVEATVFINKGGAFFVVHEWETPATQDRDGITKHYFEAITRDELDRLITRKGESIEIIDESIFELPPETTAESEPSATIYIRVPASLKRRADAAAAAAKLSTNAYAMRCLESCLSAT